jgi:hypothetical protein
MPQKTSSQLIALTSGRSERLKLCKTSNAPVDQAPTLRGATEKVMEKSCEASLQPRKGGQILARH